MGMGYYVLRRLLILCVFGFSSLVLWSGSCRASRQQKPGGGEGCLVVQEVREALCSNKREKKLRAVVQKLQSNKRLCKSALYYFFNANDRTGLTVVLDCLLPVMPPFKNSKIVFLEPHTPGPQRNALLFVKNIYERSVKERGRFSGVEAQKSFSVILDRVVLESHARALVTMVFMKHRMDEPFARDIVRNVWSYRPGLCLKNF